MTALGRPRDETIQRDLRHCDIHGLVEFAGRITGHHASLSWQCMSCDNEKGKKRYADKKAGLIPSFGEVRKTPDMVFCERCTMLLPTSGICGECE